MNALQNTRQIVYVPPAAEVIDTYARQVCLTLERAEKGGAADLEARVEFASFLKIVVQMYAKHLTNTRQNKYKGNEGK